jgi:hypothetical protein
MYWDINKTLSHNMFLNMIVGMRNAGKTYGCKEWAIKDFKKTGKQFIYLRRYKEELRGKKREQFWNDIREQFPDDDLTVKGNVFLINDKEAGQFMPLSTAQTVKSVPFPNVNKIIFDEFIIDKGCYHYLPDEVTLFLEFLETIIRTRNDVKVFLLANAITIHNPYFLYWDVKVPKNGSIYKDKKRGVLLEMTTDDELIAVKKRTQMGRLIAGTAYERYSIENDFLRDNNDFIEKKTGHSDFYFAYKFKNNMYGVWIDYSAGRMYVSNDIDPCNKLVYSVTLDDHSPNTLLIRNSRRSIFIKNFIEAYQAGNVRFENAKLKAITYDVIKMFLT